MRRPVRPKETRSVDSESRTLTRWAPKFSAHGPVLDAGCGEGRNAIALARMGYTIVCADKDLRRLNKVSSESQAHRLSDLIVPVCIDLAPGLWPFKRNCFSAVICVHFLDLNLLPFMHSSLCDGGALFIETVGGQGENYRALPRAGVLHSLLAPHFSFDFYKERPVGPDLEQKRAVRLLARKANDSAWLQP